MDMYIALKPVRFDRTYAVGETIPGNVIDPRSVKRLTEAGKIAKLPSVPEIPVAPEASTASDAARAPKEAKKGK